MSAETSAGGDARAARGVAETLRGVLERTLSAELDSIAATITKIQLSPLAPEDIENLADNAARMFNAIIWALGYEDFAPRPEGAGAYWWRTELQRRAFDGWRGSPPGARPSPATGSDAGALLERADKRIERLCNALRVARFTLTGLHHPYPEVSRSEAVKGTVIVIDNALAYHAATAVAALAPESQQPGSPPVGASGSDGDGRDAAAVTWLAAQLVVANVAAIAGRLYEGEFRGGMEMACEEIQTRLEMEARGEPSLTDELRAAELESHQRGVAPSAENTGDAQSEGRA